MKTKKTNLTFLSKKETAKVLFTTTIFFLMLNLKVIAQVSYNQNSIPITGQYNSAFGTQTLFSNTTGVRNTATGFKALYANTTGAWNTANGTDALRDNITGSYNTGTGKDALAFSTTGSYNTAYGVRALLYNIAGSNATAIGNGAMWYCNNTTTPFINYNVAVGFEALRGSTTPAANTGDNNTAIGYQALFNNQAGRFNVALGHQTLYNNISGVRNTATGYNALYFNTGSRNTANGHYALSSNTSGTENTAMGDYALKINTSGSFNTAIGKSAFHNNTTGSYNTALGHNAIAALNNLTNATAIGANALVSTSNNVVIGNSSITKIGGYANWSNLSDARFKKDIQQNVHGLDFIMQLNPVTYSMDIRKLNTFLGIDDRKAKLQEEDKLPHEERAKLDRIEEESIAKKEAIRYTGFIAQEVEQAAKAISYDFSGVSKPANEKDHYSISYSDFVVPLVKAVQEQQKIIEQQNKINEQLQQQIDELKKLVGKLNNSSSTANIELDDKNTVVLNQNVPNPFAEKTTISYDIPQTAGMAQVIFYNANGQLVKSVNVSKGKGQLNIYSADLKSGSYSYTLVVDSKIVDTKKMIKQ